MLASTNEEKIETIFFTLLTTLLICRDKSVCKAVGKVDMGPQVSCISLNFLINVKTKNEKKVERYLTFLSRSVKRIAVAFPLKFKYANGIVF
jgi:hypothetical protein